MSIPVLPPYLLYHDLSGKPLQNGSLYFGAVGQNPIAFPVTVYWNSGLTQVAEQPIRTLNGYPARDGTPAVLFCATDFSVLVQNNNDVNVFYVGSSQSTLLAAAATAVQGNLTTHIAQATNAHSASAIGYSSSVSGLGANNTQQAIDNHVTSATAHASSNITYNNTVSGLTASNVKAAIDEIVSDVNTKTDKTVIEKFFESSPITIAAGGSGTITHNLGRLPRLVTPYLVCTADDQGYVAGDPITVSFYEGSTPKGVTFTLGVNTIRYDFVNSAEVFAAVNKSTKAGVGLNNTKWQMVIQLSA